MLPQLPGIPLQTTAANADTTRNLNQLLPVDRNVNATVVAVSRDQVQPDVFRVQVEINNRLLQLGVFQPLPVGQKINVNRQSDGQIQITLQNNNNPAPTRNDASNTAAQSNTPQTNTQATQTNTRSAADSLLSLQLNNQQARQQIPEGGRIIAAIISSRPAFPQTGAQTQPAPNGNARPAAGATANPVQQAATAATSTTNNNAIAGNNQTPLTLSPSTNSVPAPVVASTATSTAPSTATPITTPTTPAGSATATNSSAVQQSAQPPATGPQANPVVTQTSTTPASQTNTTAPAQPTQQPSAAAASTVSRSSNETASQPAINQSTGSTPSRADILAAIQRPSAAPSHHVLTLALPNGSQVEVNSPQPLPQGTQVLLQRTGTDSAQIVKTQTPGFEPRSALERPGIQDALRIALPTQLPAGEAFSQLAQTATNSAQGAQISSAVRSLLQLFGVQPGSQESPEQIRRNVELGGLSTERNLSKGLPPSPQDMRSQLQQLNRLAENLPFEQRERMEQLLRGIHSRVTSQQIGSLQQWQELPGGGFERVLQLDLPIKQGDQWENLELRLSREGGSNAAGEMVSLWRVRLHFDLEERGEVDAEIRLTDEHQISTYFWCEKPETAEQLRQRSDEFAQRLRESGFQDMEVQSHEGQAPEHTQVLQKQLVDLHT